MTGPNLTVVPFSVVGKSGRMDANFHVILNYLRGRVNNLKAQKSSEQISDFLSGLSVSDKEVLLLLAEGSNDKNKKRKIDSVCKKHPYLSLAMVMEDIDDSITRVRKEIFAQQEYLDKLIEISDIRPDQQRHLPETLSI